MVRKFKIAQIGTGNRGMATLRALAEYPDRIEIAAVCDTDPEKVKQVADQYGVPGFSSVEELLNRASFEVASVTTATPVRQMVAAHWSRRFHAMTILSPFITRPTGVKVQH